MGRFLTYMYLVVALYCVVNVFLSIQAGNYQFTWICILMAGINYALFTLFRKHHAKQVKLKLIDTAKQ